MGIAYWSCGIGLIAFVEQSWTKETLCCSCLLLLLPLALFGCWEKTRKGVIAVKEKITFLSEPGNKRNRKRKSWGCCSKGVIEESYTYLNLVLVVSVFGGTKTTEKATHSEEEGLDDGNVCGDGWEWWHQYICVRVSEIKRKKKKRKRKSVLDGARKR